MPEGSGGEAKQGDAVTTAGIHPDRKIHPISAHEIK
jgi:hypothetical protein